MDLTLSLPSHNTHLRKSIRTTSPSSRPSLALRKKSTLGIGLSLSLQGTSCRPETIDRSSWNKRSSLSQLCSARTRKSKEMRRRRRVSREAGFLRRTRPCRFRWAGLQRSSRRRGCRGTTSRQAWTWTWESTTCSPSECLIIILDMFGALRSRTTRLSVVGLDSSHSLIHYSSLARYYNYIQQQMELTAEEKKLE